MMGGGRMNNNFQCSQSRASSSSSMFNVEVRMLDCWCHRRCDVRKASISKNPGKPFYTCPLPKDDNDNCDFLPGLMKLKN